MKASSGRAYTAATMRLDGFSTVTLTIAIIGLCIALGTLVWQWRSWLYEGPKLKVAVGQAFGLDAVREMPAMDLLVTVQNVGRSPVQLTGWGFEMPDKTTLVDLDATRPPTSLPFTLNGGHETYFVMELATVIDAATGGGGS